MSMADPSSGDVVIDVVDTHQHLWDLSRLDYSWTKGIPILNRSFTYDDYVAAARASDDEAAPHEDHSRRGRPGREAPLR
ncbi:MAG: hypothetical protein QM770_01810 [Tepidisphaeraceae bacterium]